MHKDLSQQRADEPRAQLSKRLWSHRTQPWACISAVANDFRSRVTGPGQLRYDNVFHILIVQFMDARSLDIRALKRSCIHTARPDGRLIPFEAYNICYRDEQASGLAALRSALAPALTEHADASQTLGGGALRTCSAARSILKERIG